MKQAFNFNAGPCVLPKQAIESTVKALYDFDNTGIGIAEISHRTPGWERIMAETRQLWRDLLNIPEEYEVLFLGGGASTQFFTVPANLMKTKADYFHITTNNTIYGTEIKYDMDCPIMLVADMSSDIMSRPVDVKKYGLIYGGAQKNVGPAGVTFVIVKKSILGNIGDRAYMNPLPTMVDYRTHAAEEAKNISMFNTPPVLPIFMMHETLVWLKDTIGGVEAMNKINTKKSQMLYEEIDRNSMFVGTAEKEDRSIMNHCWVMAPGYEDKQDAFMAFAKERGMVGIKGHRSVGGFRASLYNACPIEAVEALVQCMQDFEKANK